VVTLLPDADIQDIFSEKCLLLNPRHKRFSILSNNKYVIQLGAVANVLVALQTVSDKAIAAVYVQLLVVGDNLNRRNRLEALDFRLALAAFTVFLKQLLIVRDGVVGEVFKVMLRLLQMFLQVAQRLISLEAVILRNPLDLNFGQSDNVIGRDFPVELLLVGLKALIDNRDHLLPGVGLFDIPVNPVFNEY